MDFTHNKTFDTFFEIARKSHRTTHHHPFICLVCFFKEIRHSMHALCARWVEGWEGASPIDDDVVKSYVWWSWFSENGKSGWWWWRWWLTIISNSIRNRIMVGYIYGNGIRYIFSEAVYANICMCGIENRFAFSLPAIWCYMLQ